MSSDLAIYGRTSPSKKERIRGHLTDFDAQAKLTTKPDVSGGGGEAVAKVPAGGHAGKAHLVHGAHDQVAPGPVVADVQLAQAALGVVVVRVAAAHHVRVGPGQLQ